MDTIIAENLRIINEANDALMARMAPMAAPAPARTCPVKGPKRLVK